MITDVERAQKYVEELDKFDFSDPGDVKNALKRTAMRIYMEIFRLQDGVKKGNLDN